MPFKVPTFNLLCNIWNHAPAYPPAAIGAPDLANVPCQLRLLKTAAILGPTNTTFIMDGNLLLLPKGTDIQGSQGWGTAVAGFPLVECPAGSGRFYATVHVDDACRGFTNEYRWAAIQQIPGACPFPIP